MRVLLIIVGAWCLAAASGDEADWQRHRDAGLAAYRQGHHAEAVSRTELALAEAEKFGERDTRFAETLANLAFLYREADRRDESERAFLRSVAVWEAIVGEEHEIVGQTLNSLGSLYDIQGRFEEAEPVFERALAIAQKAHGFEHSAVARVSYNLARVYQALGRPEDAESTFGRTLALQEKLLGRDHPETGRTLRAEGLDRFLYRLDGVVERGAIVVDGPEGRPRHLYWRRRRELEGP